METLQGYIIKLQNSFTDGDFSVIYSGRLLGGYYLQGVLEECPLTVDNNLVVFKVPKEVLTENTKEFLLTVEGVVYTVCVV